ncbi:hypothetical protein BD413DRAFT_296488 [Trametes elegans]|nr:hypothetical protein BD413DRAFT_296488 [Trametes elegans]
MLPSSRRLLHLLLLLILNTLPLLLASHRSSPTSPPPSFFVTPSNFPRLSPPAISPSPLFSPPCSPSHPPLIFPALLSAPPAITCPTKPFPAFTMDVYMGRTILLLQLALADIYTHIPYISKVECINSLVPVCHRYCAGHRHYCITPVRRSQQSSWLLESGMPAT